MASSEPGDQPTDAPALTVAEVAGLKRLLDRQAVIDCVLRYARGLDRSDEELLRSAYDDDAVEDHGAYVGGLDGLVAFLGAAHASFAGYQRYVTNTTVELDGDGDGATAHAESYYLCVLRRAPAGEGDDGSGGDLLLNGGRYVDRLERRDGAWRILRRVVVSEWEGALDGGAPLYPSNVTARRDRGDVSYDRPLDVTT